MINIGQTINDMAMEAYHQEEIKKINLSDYKGRWLVLLFYPADFTFICPTELEDAAKHYEDFKKTGAEILSVSTDTVYAHKAWHDTSGAVGQITFPMVADPTGKLSREFGTYLEDEGLSLRASFIIDPDGVLKSMEMHDNSIGRNIKEILRKLQAAKFVREHNGLVCPANWEEGGKTLKPGLDLVGKI